MDYILKEIAELLAGGDPVVIMDIDFENTFCNASQVKNLKERVHGIK